MGTTTPDSRLIRQARLAESLAILWMMVELVVALAAGIAARSVALIWWIRGEAREALEAARSGRHVDD